MLVTSTQPNHTLAKDNYFGNSFYIQQTPVSILHLLTLSLARHAIQPWLIVGLRRMLLSKLAR